MLSMGLNAGEIALLQKAIKKVVAGGLDALDTLFSVERPPKPPFRGAHGRRRSRGREGTTSFSNTEFTGSMSSTGFEHMRTTGGALVLQALAVKTSRSSTTARGLNHARCTHV